MINVLADLVVVTSIAASLYRLSFRCVRGSEECRGRGKRDRECLHADLIVNLSIMADCGGHGSRGGYQERQDPPRTSRRQRSVDLDHRDWRNWRD